MKPKLLVAAALILGMAAGNPLPAMADLVGTGSVVTGSALLVGGKPFRLFEIDAVDLHQFCYVDGKPWTCGAAAIRAFETLIAPEQVSCHETGGDPDPVYGPWATCTVGGLDIAEDLVRQGMVVANPQQSDMYVATEQQAKADNVGLWKSVFAPPAVYRQQLAEVEKRASDRARAALPKLADAALTDGNGGIDVFQGFHIVRGGDGLADYVASGSLLEDGFILKSVSGDVFDWNEPAQKLAGWRTSVVGALQREAAAEVWASLQSRPKQTIDVKDGAAFLAAAAAAAKPWSDAGRHPVVIVRGQDDPPWVKDWLGDAPPADVTVTHNDSIKSPSYRVTVNGLDLYIVDALPEQQALVLPDDLLATIHYGPKADGSLVSIAYVPPSGKDPGATSVSFSAGMDWKPDQITELHYDYTPPASPYAP